MVGPIGGPRLHNGQVGVEVKLADVVPQQLADSHREVIVAVDDGELCQDPLYSCLRCLGVLPWQEGSLRSNKEKEDEKRHDLPSIEETRRQMKASSYQCTMGNMEIEIVYS